MLVKEVNLIHHVERPTENLEIQAFNVSKILKYLAFSGPSKSLAFPAHVYI